MRSINVEVYEVAWEGAQGQFIPCFFFKMPSWEQSFFLDMDSNQELCITKYMKSFC